MTSVPIDTWVADSNEAIRTGSTTEHVANRRAILADPPAHLKRASVARAAVEAQLAAARSAEDEQIRLAAEHETLVVAVEKAQRDLARLNERLAFNTEALGDEANSVARCDLVLRDDPYAMATARDTYATLASLQLQTADVRRGIPTFERRVKDALAALAEFRQKNGIKSSG